VADYETYGTDRLAEAIVDALSGTDSRACVMKNHGLVCFGDSLEEAFDIAEGVEFTARITCQGRMVGSPQTLSDRQIKDVADKFKHYGQESD